MEVVRREKMHMTPGGASFMDIPVSAGPRCVCVGISHLMYALRCFIRFTKMVCQWIFFLIQFDFLFLSKHRILGDLRQPGRKVSGCVLAAVCWHISAKPFCFPATLLGGSNKQSASCFPHYCPRIPRSLWKYRGNTYSFESRDRDSLWLLARSFFRRKGSRVPGEVFVVAGSRLALRDTLTSPLARAVNAAAGASFGQREHFHCRFPGLESCKHICLLNTNNLHVLRSLTL